MADEAYTPLDNKTLAAQVLQQLDAIIPQMASGAEVSSYSINGRTFTLRSMEEAMKARQEWFRIYTEATVGDTTYLDARTFTWGTR